jgi:Flp pilus assembly protein TadG
MIAMMLWTKPMRRLLASERGSSLVEVALLAPFLGMLVVGISDLGQGYAEVLRVRQAAHRALELGMVKPATLNRTTNEVDYSYIKSQAAEAAGVPESNVTLTPRLECNGTEKTPYSANCTAGQDMARYLQLAISSSYRPSFGWGPLGRNFAGAAADGSVPINVNVAVRIQ